MTTGPVELRYTLTAADLVDAIATQRAVNSRRWTLALLLLPLVGVAIGLVRSDAWELTAEGAVIVLVVCAVLAVVAGGLGLLVSKVFVRWVHRWQASMLMRGNPAFAHPCRTTVTEAGLHADNTTGESRSSWSQYPLYAETDRSFVLLASKRLGAMMFVLPKRALADDDRARLRALLDTHSSRRA
ncbi:YcxB family protein [Asanoa iriomotensis]|uniref:YcxB-like C-terminal domain-containing protein n=1 Tax=Asanoa iriomotensis TaxID=234613 RepID=A0ABQ4BVM3_9ACTN|nr:YcxB family protein [Asanoa iriomotensis]GIF54567.1 hypothetical protein Air01nite_06620 [Asanoa iriomotensis]